MDILFAITLTLLILFAVALYFRITIGICMSRKRLEGQTCLVTGGTSGIGLNVAIDFAKRGARVIVACPFQEEGESARQKIVEESDNEKVIFKHLDLGSFDSVRKFAADILKNEKRLDILMNNAGVGTLSQITNDGFSIITQVNYLGAFLLTILLMPLLKKTGTPSAPSRIVNTSSVLHRFAFLDIKNMASQKSEKNFFKKIIIYGNSKLCLLLFSRELTKRLAGSNVVINDADPGATATRILTAENILGYTIFLFCLLYSKTAVEGAQNLLHAALDDKAGKVSGKFFKNCVMCSPSSKALNDKTAKCLWDQSMAFVKISEAEVEKNLK